MDILVFALVLVVLTAFVALPLYERHGPSHDLRSAAHDEPAAVRHEALVRALRDLEVDHTSGLLTEADYDLERSALEAEAAARESPTD